MGLTPSGDACHTCPVPPRVFRPRLTPPRGLGWGVCPDCHLGDYQPSAPRLTAVAEQVPMPPDAWGNSIVDDTDSRECRHEVGVDPSSNRLTTYECRPDYPLWTVALALCAGVHLCTALTLGSWRSTRQQGTHHLPTTNPTKEHCP